MGYLVVCVEVWAAFLGFVVDIICRWIWELNDKATERCWISRQEQHLTLDIIEFQCQCIRLSRCCFQHFFTTVGMREKVYNIYACLIPLRKCFKQDFFVKKRVTYLGVRVESPIFIFLESNQEIQLYNRLLSKRNTQHCSFQTQCSGK